jgi:broad specificity phosphatase PhoE
MIDIYLIRHGESESNERPDLIGGRNTESPLSEHGLTQAHSLGRWLDQRDIRFDIVMSSPAKRATQTAQVATRRKPVILEDSEELHQGDWQDVPRGDVYTPSTIKEIKANLLDFAAPNGESKRDVATRMKICMENHVLTLPKGTKVAWFGHGFAFKCLLWAIMKFDPYHIYPITLDNCSITRLQYDPDEKEFQFRCINQSTQPANEWIEQCKKMRYV